MLATGRGSTRTACGVELSRVVTLRLGNLRGYRTYQEWIRYAPVRKLAIFHIAFCNAIRCVALVIPLLIRFLNPHARIGKNARAM